MSLIGPDVLPMPPEILPDPKDLEYEIRTARLWSISHATIHGCPSGYQCPVRDAIAEVLRKLIAMRAIARDSSPLPSLPSLTGGSPLGP